MKKHRNIQQVAGKFPIIKDLDIDYDKAPAQLKYVQDIMAKSLTGTFGFYNESLASVEAGDCFDNAMVDIFLETRHLKKHSRPYRHSMRRTFGNKSSLIKISYKPRHMAAAERTKACSAAVFY